MGSDGVVLVVGTGVEGSVEGSVDGSVEGYLVVGLYVLSGISVMGVGDGIGPSPSIATSEHPLNCS